MTWRSEVAGTRTGCPEAEHHPVGRGIDNGYAFTLWRLSCPLSKTSGKPEHAWFKAIAGRDSFYLVQNAFRATPSREQAIAATSYLAQVKVCDTRLADRPCPSVAQPDQP